MPSRCRSVPSRRSTVATSGAPARGRARRAPRGPDARRRRRAARRAAAGGAARRRGCRRRCGARRGRECRAGAMALRAVSACASCGMKRRRPRVGLEVRAAAGFHKLHANIRRPKRPACSPVQESPPAESGANESDAKRRCRRPPSARSRKPPPARRARSCAASKPKEVGGPSGPDPVRYGDWERKGIASDF